MRLALGLLGALVCHGLVFGVALAFLPRQSPHPALVAALDVDVVPARPQPVAPAAPALAAPSLRHLRRPIAPSAVRPPPAPAPPAIEAGPSPSPAAGRAVAAAPVAAGRAASPPAVSMKPAAPSLSAQPRYRSNPPPEYPTVARRRHEEGVVSVRVSVSAQGLPDGVALERSCGHPLLDDAAVQAVRRWTFEPARAAGNPVPSLVVVPVRFSLADAH